LGKPPGFNQKLVDRIFDRVKRVFLPSQELYEGAGMMVERKGGWFDF